MKIISLIFKIIILLILFYIAINNLNKVDFFWSINHKIELPLICLLFISFIIGVLFGLLSFLSKYISLFKKNLKFKKSLKLNNVNSAKN